MLHTVGTVSYRGNRILFHNDDVLRDLGKELTEESRSRSREREKTIKVPDDGYRTCAREMDTRCVKGLPIFIILSSSTHPLPHVFLI